MEAAGLGGFMASAALVTTLVEYPQSPIRILIDDATVRRALIGLAMGLTAMGLIYSPWGKQSGAHLNPSVTLAFLRMGKIRAVDAAGYVAAQFLGGTAGLWLVAQALQPYLADPAVRYAVTVPGRPGVVTAFTAEVIISFGLMLVVLSVSNHRTFAPWTGTCAAALVAAYIVVEAPLSGMSMNPARTLASAVPAQVFTALWLYFTAPPLGMMLAAELYTRVRRDAGVACPKLHHANGRRCIFCDKASEPRCHPPCERTVGGPVRHAFSRPSGSANGSARDRAAS